jgi:hypothetical protein
MVVVWRSEVKSEAMRRGFDTRVVFSRHHGERLVQQEVATWDLSNQRVNFTYQLASKFL